MRIGRLPGARLYGGTELLEALPGPLKVIMDARDLKFLDGTFNTATASYMLMYVGAPDRAQAFREIYRVLALAAGFRIVERRQGGQQFSLELQKPPK